MTFAEICKAHEPDEQLAFRHPDLDGVCVFTEAGQLIFFDHEGHQLDGAPLWLSDFDRNDWVIVPNETD